MAYEWINFNELAYSVNGGEAVSLKPYVSGGLGTLTSTFLSDPATVRGYNVRAQTAPADYAMVGSCVSSSFNLLEIFAQYPSGSYIDVFNPKIGNAVSYRVTINKSTAQLTSSIRIFGNTYPVNMVTYGPESDGEVCLSFIFDDTTVDGKVSLWYRGSYDDWQGNHRVLRETGATNTAFVYLMYSDNAPSTPSTDPYAPGGNSTTGGAGGSFNDESDEIDVPAVPLLNLSLNHFISTYAPTVTQLNDLADFMWSDWLSQGPTLSKIFADPSDAIISLHMLPFTPATATAVTVTIGSYSTGVSMDPLTLQFYTIDCGELAIEEYWGNYLDYNPYTKLTLFLPYVGEITLNPDEVMGQTIGIKYRVDALTGAFVCFVTRADKKILGEYQGNCALEVPISSANYAQLHSALLGLAGTAVAAGAAGITGGVSSLLNGAPGVIKSAAGVMDSKVRHSHGGSLGSAAGFMGSQKPYLIIERARQCLPERLNEFAGYPSQVTARLGDQTGFTSVSDVILDGIPLTDGELNELREILKGGIYV